MEERKREWKKDSRRWNRQLMDCLLWADSGMSTDSHLHEQALSSKESMSQPPSPPLSLTNTHGQNATKIWLYWTVLLYHTLTVRQAHTRTHTHTPWTQDILALRCQLSCYLVFKVSDWATDSPLFYRSDFHTSPHWCQQDLVTFHSPSVTFLFCKPPRENSVFSITNQRSFLESEAYLFHHKRKTTRRSVTFSWKLHHHGRYLQSCKAWNVK